MSSALRSESCRASVPEGPDTSKRSTRARISIHRASNRDSGFLQNAAAEVIQVRLCRHRSRNCLQLCEDGVCGSSRARTGARRVWEEWKWGLMPAPLAESKVAKAAPWPCEMVRGSPTP
eukprot:603254-Alexandrium_andersonii.AAC.1